MLESSPCLQHINKRCKRNINCSRLCPRNNTPVLTISYLPPILTFIVIKPLTIYYLCPQVSSRFSMLLLKTTGMCKKKKKSQLCLILTQSWQFKCSSCLFWPHEDKIHKIVFLLFSVYFSLDWSVSIDVHAKLHGSPVGKCWHILFLYPCFRRTKGHSFPLCHITSLIKVPPFSVPPDGNNKIKRYEVTIVMGK